MTIPRRIKKITSKFKYNNKLDNLNKSHFEIIISRYDEDITWSDNYKKFRTIYNKGLDNIETPYIKLENKGHLADTILRHIILNYNNLANVTFFTHGSFNYRNDQLIKDTGKCHKLFHDFIQTDKDTLVYIKKRGLPDKNKKFKNYPKTVGNVYKSIFNKDYKKKFPWAIGKWISVSKERIHKTPIKIYKKMLDFVLDNYKNKEPSQKIYRTRGIYIERFILSCFI